jgi:4-alpha-glucanotransferase
MSKSVPSPVPPLFNWLDHRAAGVLLHPTSLPGSSGIGALDSAADDFLAFLAHAGFRYWQTCPLGPTGFGDSPYQTFSSFAGNPYLIDLQPLAKLGLLTAADLARLSRLPADRVDFGTLFQEKPPLLFRAHATWRNLGQPALPYGDFRAFCARHAAWLDSYALFSALKDHHSGRPWWEWSREFRSHATARNSALRQSLGHRIEAYAFQQYLFFGQWERVRAQARQLGIEIIGDIPIFTALDSADVWGAPHLFQLDPESSRPVAVAGVPPDYFSADGQLWGNPLYDWDAHAVDGYAWWLARLEAAYALCDVVRIDHFRGFEAYWSIPAGAPNARRGQWLPGPGLDFFHRVRTHLPRARLIAEDLGLLTPATIALREATGLPGMAVLQFAFGGDARNLYLPHNLHANCVLYPGTHDNDTARGWYAAAGAGVQDHVRRYFRISGQEIPWDFARAAYASVANLIVIPLQDLLNLGPEARFNTPGRAQGNWTWRYRAEQLRQLTDHSAAYLRELAALYGRDRAVTPASETV